MFKASVLIYHHLQHRLREMSKIGASDLGCVRRSFLRILTQRHRNGSYPVSVMLVVPLTSPSIIEWSTYLSYLLSPAIHLRAIRRAIATSLSVT